MWKSVIGCLSIVSRTRSPPGIARALCRVEYVNFYSWWMVVMLTLIPIFNFNLSFLILQVALTPSHSLHDLRLSAPPCLFCRVVNQSEIRFEGPENQESSLVSYIKESNLYFVGFGFSIGCSLCLLCFR